MDNRLMTEQDIQDVTGVKRHGAQMSWFKRHFGITPVQRADGRIILTWAAFEGLQAKRAGISGNSQSTARPALQPIRSVA